MEFEGTEGTGNAFHDGKKQYWRICKMITTIIGAVITALAIEADKVTQYKHPGFPVVALAGVLTVIVSLVL